MAAYHLMRGRLRVLLDNGETDRGTVVEANLGTYKGLYMPIVEPEDPEDPTAPRVCNNHVVFVPENTTEVEVEGITYKIMNMDAIVALICDEE